MGVTAQDQQSRAEFEAAWQRKTGVTKPKRFPNGGDYVYPAANTAWWAWQAARALPAGVEPELFVQRAEDGEPVTLLTQHQATACRETIEAVGGTLEPLYTAAQVQAMGRVPETWAIYDSEGLYETRDTEEACKTFCDHYNARDKKLGGGLGQYTYKALYAAAPQPPAAQERKPLSIQRINELEAEAGLDHYELVRLVEAEHGITHPTGD